METNLLKTNIIKTITLGGVGALLFSLGAAAPAHADDWHRPYNVRHDRRVVRHDRRDLHRDWRRGSYYSAYREREELRRQRRFLHRDRYWDPYW